jgi:ankyrin repeat protein
MGCGQSSAPIADGAKDGKDQAKITSKHKKLKPGEIDYKPIHSACRWNTAPIDEIKKLLNNPKAVVCIDPGNGNTPLHIAAQNGHSNIVEILLGLNAPINVQNSSGNTPAHMSIEYDYYATSKMLVDAGADLEIKNQKDCPAKKGIEGTKNYIFMPLFDAKTTDEVMKVLDACLSNISELEKASFAGLGLRSKKNLGPSIWTDQVQEKFKDILRQIT